MSRVAVRYSKALFDLTVEQNQIEMVQNDLGMIRDVCSENPDINAALNNPLIDEFIKARLLKELFQDQVRPLTFNFLQLLSRKKRSGFLPEIIGYFNERVLEYQNILPATLFFAEKVTVEQVERIKSRIEKLTGKSILITEQHDPSILGGFIVRIRDTVIDLSIKTQLDKLRRRLING